MSDLVAVLSADTSQLQKELNNARNILQKYSKDASSMNGVSAQQAEAFRKSTNSLNTLVNSSKGAKAQMNGLKREVQNLSIQYSQLSDEARKGEFGKALASTINEANGKLQTLQKNLEATSTQLKKVGSSTSSSFKFNDIKSELSGISPEMSNIVSFGSKLANPYVLATASAVALGKAVYDYGVELEEQVSKTEKFLGLSKESATAVRDAIVSICDAYGTDYDSALGMVDQLTKQFGIDAKSATDLISVGMAGGANEAGHMADMVSKFSGLFADAGISAEQFIGIMAQTQSGIFSEQGLDIIAKAQAKLTQMSSATASALQDVGIDAKKMGEELSNGSLNGWDAIKQVSTAIKDLDPNCQQFASVVKEVFGKVGVQAGSEMIKMLSDMDVSIQGVIDDMTEDERATYELQKADEDLQNAMASMFGLSEGGFSTMTKQLKTSVYRALTNIINKFIELYNKSTLIRGGIASICLQFKNMWLACKTAVKLIGNSISGLADVFEDIITGDFSKAISDWAKHKNEVARIGMDFGKEFMGNMNDAMQSTMNGHLDNIKLESGDGGTFNTGHGKSGGGTKSGKSSSKSGKSSTDKLADAIEKFQRQLVALSHESLGLDTTAENKVKAKQDEFDKERNQKISQNDLDTSRKQELYQRNSKAFDNIQNQVDLGELDPECAQRLVDELNEQLSRNEIDLKFNLDTSGVAGKTKKIAEGMQSASNYTNMLAGALQNVNSVAQSDGINIAVVIAQAVAQVVGAYAETLAKDKSSKSNIWSFIAAAAASTISMATTIASMKSAGSYASGGIIGGTTTIGDYNIAHVNSGEMILNGTQQGRLFSILNGTSGIGNVNSGNSSVDFKIRGKDLIGVQKNYYKKQSRL